MLRVGKSNSSSSSCCFKNCYHRWHEPLEKFEAKGGLRERRVGNYLEQQPNPCPHRLSCSPVGTKVGTPKMAPDLKVPSTVCVHFGNQLCTYLDGVLLEMNFDP